MTGEQPLSLDEVKAEIEVLDPSVRGQDGTDPYAVIVFSAFYVTGPCAEELARFTGYADSFVSEVADRMFEAGLWEKPDIVHGDHWRRGDQHIPELFWADVLVAQGLLGAKREHGTFRRWVIDKKRVEALIRASGEGRFQMQNRER